MKCDISRRALLFVALVAALTLACRVQGWAVNQRRCTVYAKKRPCLILYKLSKKRSRYSAPMRKGFPHRLCENKGCEEEESHCGL